MEQMDQLNSNLSSVPNEFKVEIANNSRPYVNSHLKLPCYQKS